MEPPMNADERRLKQVVRGNADDAMVLKYLRSSVFIGG